MILNARFLQIFIKGRGPVYFGEYNILLDDTEKGTINFQEFPQVHRSRLLIFSQKHITLSNL